MSFQYITTKDSPNFGYPDGTRGQNRPTKIIIHHWGIDGQSFNGVVNWLCDPASGASAHLVVEGGKAACIVNWNDAAWHAGSRSQNQSSIGIECRPECSDKDFDTVAQVVAMIWKSYGKVLPLIGHKDVANTECPGRYYKRLKELTELAKKYYKGTPQSSPTKPKTQTSTKNFKVKVTAKDLWIRAGAGINTAKRGFIRPGIYTITETKTNGGIEWGKLKSGAGWIALKYTTRL